MSQPRIDQISHIRSVTTQQYVEAFLLDAVDPYSMSLRHRNTRKSHFTMYLREKGDTVLALTLIFEPNKFNEHEANKEIYTYVLDNFSLTDTLRDYLEKELG